MSPRAAWRLESLGFREVYEYRPGKSDWLAAGLPTEGPGASTPRAGAYLRDVPTCGPDDPIGDVAARVRESGADVCFVVNEHGILFGRLDARQLEGDAGARAADVMKSGPSTYRPDTSATALFHRLTEHGITKVPITTSEGRLLGAAYRDDLARAHEHVTQEQEAPGSA